MKNILVSFWKLIRDAAVKWDQDNATRLSAALAYYTIFSLTPLLIFAIAIAGFFFGGGAAREEALGRVREIVGASGTQYVDNLIDLAQKPSSTLLASLMGLVTLLLGAASGFVELQQGLDTIWHVKPPGSGLKYFLRQRLFSFAAILAIGGILLALLVLGTVLAFIGRFFSYILPISTASLGWLNFALSFAITTILFATIYKILPDAKVKWKEVWLGAGIASLMFSVGKYFIGLYLRHSSMTSLYGAAGSFVLILLWIYYSAHILFFGAEITVVHARKKRGVTSSGTAGTKSK